MNERASSVALPELLLPQPAATRAAASTARTTMNLGICSLLLVTQRALALGRPSGRRDRRLGSDLLEHPSGQLAAPLRVGGAEEAHAHMRPGAREARDVGRARD